jgi:amino acid transporter
MGMSPDEAGGEKRAEGAAARGPRLKRSISLPLITLYGLGTTVGAGIYVLVGKVAAHADLFTPAAFLVAGLLAGLTAFSFAELAARYPKSAGEALYVREGLRSTKLALAVGLLVALSGVISAGAITLGAAGYLMAQLALPQWLLVVLVALLLGGLAAVFTLLEVGGLLLVIWAGASGPAAPLAHLPELLPPFEPGVWSGIMAGAFLAFYAFIGFEDMVNVAEEVKRVRVTLPLAIVLTLVLTMLLYLALTAVAVLSVPLGELADSTEPLALVYERAGGRYPVAIRLIAIFATLNGALIQVIMASRVLYGLSRQGALPAALGAVLGRVDARTRTPLVATLLVTAAVLVLALWLPIEALAAATSTVALVVFSLVNLALIMIKRRDPRPPGIWRVPAAIPFAGLLASSAFLALELTRLAGG